MKRYVIVERKPLPERKPVYDDLEEATAQLLEIRRDHPAPDTIVLVEIDSEAGPEAQARDLNVREVRENPGRP